MKKIALIIALLLISIAFIYAAYHLFMKNDQGLAGSGKSELYICPMHPEIQSNHPGVCPICHMDLVLKEEVIDSTEDHDRTKPIKEKGEVTLSPAQQVMANVQTEVVRVKEYKYDLTLDGYVKAPENNLRRIATPVSGKIIRMYLNYDGQNVSKGMKAFDIYSPEIYSAQKEYLLALQNYESTRNSSYAIVRDQAEELLNSTRTRLRLWEVTAEQIAELEQLKEAPNFITVRSAYNGIVTSKMNNEGQWVSAGEGILELADLSTLWIIAKVPESELSHVRQGQSGIIKSVSYPGETFTGKANFISPVLDPETRTLEVRFDVANRNYRLKPDMYVSIDITAVRIEWNIVVPRNAVIRYGKEDLVYVKSGKNSFSPRRVSVGGEKDEYYLIESGLNEGDEIVISAGFLLDSESRIRSGSTSGNSQTHDAGNERDEKLNPESDVIKDMKEHNH
jgi:RND family efflux transporter MFP subunit